MFSLYTYIYIYLVLKKYSRIRLQVSCCFNHQVYIIYDLKITKQYTFMCMSETVQISFNIFKQ